MTYPNAKHTIPVERVRRYLEPGPIVLVSSRWEQTISRRHLFRLGDAMTGGNRNARRPALN
jgi:hypothetical protein